MCVTVQWKQYNQNFMRTTASIQCYIKRVSKHTWKIKREISTGENII